MTLRYLRADIRAGLGTRPSTPDLIRVSLGLLVPGTAKASAGTFIGNFPFEYDSSAIDEDVFDSFRVMQRIVVGGHVLNRRGIENRYVGEHPGTQNAAVHNSDAACSQRGHFAHSLFQAHGVLFAH